ncbi:MAG: glycosyltransferase family 4 protein [Bacteroides sp.]|nr:glycosyltransferase family 4 protein [Bacteroides sp.]
MKKLVLFCEALKNRAGIERMTVELANLLKDIYKVTIITIDPFSYDECPYKIDQEVNVITLNSQFNKSLISLNIHNIRLLRKNLLTIRPSAIIAVATPMVRIAVPAALGLSIKTIGWEHFNIFAGSTIGAMYKAIASWIVKDTVVLTEADAVDYRKFHAPNISVIPNFTSIGNHKPSKCSSNILLAVGRHASQKGFDLLLKAWAKTEAPDWKLRIVGSGEDKQKNENLTKRLKIEHRVEFKEATPDIVSEFQSASCFVLSSRFEGLVLVLIEAKMMGLPCISFDCPNSPKEVIQNGIDGWLVPPEDIDALAQELSVRLSNHDELCRAGYEGRIDALKRYSPQSIKSKWINLIEQ